MWVHKPFIAFAIYNCFKLILIILKWPKKKDPIDSSLVSISAIVSYALEDPLKYILVFDGFQRALSFHISPIFILGTLGKVRPRVRSRDM